MVNYFKNKSIFYLKLFKNRKIKFKIKCRFKTLQNSHKFKIYSINNLIFKKIEKKHKSQVKRVNPFLYKYEKIKEVEFLKDKNPKLFNEILEVLDEYG